jgi:DNA processing protein
LSSEDLQFKIALNLIEGVGFKTAKKLFSCFGDAKNIFMQKKKDLEAIEGIARKTVLNILKKETFERAEKEVKFIEKHKIETLFYKDARYPKRLKQCEDAPILLFSKGKVDYNNQKVISIVGTRKPSAYGKKVTTELIEALQENKLLVVSGLAYGIDVIAHKHAIKCNLATVGVLAHGLDKIYPTEHRSVALEMIENGSLLTEFISETIPNRENFPKRNRIVAGMADASIVIESGNKGGSMITAHLAAGYNRDVFAVPGRVDDPKSEGCNRLIKTNIAALIQSAIDVEYIMGWQTKEDKKNIQQQLFIDLTSEEEQIIGALKEKGKTTIDEICMMVNMPMSKVSVLLLTLEMNGLVRPLPGKVFECLC